MFILIFIKILHKENKMQRIKQSKLLKQIDRYFIEVKTAAGAQKLNAADVMSFYLTNLSKKENVVNISYYRLSNTEKQ